MADSTRTGAPLDGMGTQRMDLQTLLAAKHAAISRVSQCSYASVRSSIRNLVKNFRVGINNSLNDNFVLGYVYVESFGDTSIDGVTIQLSDVESSDEGAISDPSRDVVAPAGNYEFNEPGIGLLSWVSPQ